MDGWWLWWVVGWFRKYAIELFTRRCTLSKEPPPSLWNAILIIQDNLQQSVRDREIINNSCHVPRSAITSFQPLINNWHMSQHILELVRAWPGLVYLGWLYGLVWCERLIILSHDSTRRALFSGSVGGWEYSSWWSSDLCTKCQRCGHDLWELRGAPLDMDSGAEGEGSGFEYIGDKYKRDISHCCSHYIVVNRWTATVGDVSVGLRKK